MVEYQPVTLMVAGSTPVLCGYRVGVEILHLHNPTKNIPIVELKRHEAVAEWLKALDCKSNGFPSWVRIPSASTAQH